MRFCLSNAFADVGELSAVAVAADAAGYDAMAIPDHVINPVETRSAYPYTKDGGRRWSAGTHWPDPWVTIGFLAGQTRRLRFFTNIYILPLRPPVAVAKLVGTAAALSGDRVALGIGMGWMEEEFDAMEQPFARRGARADEAIELIRALWSGEVVEHHGPHFDLPPSELLPVPREPVPVWVGGLSEAALRRAARNDGWISDLHTLDELREIRARIDGYRAEYGRLDQPFSMICACIDAAGVDGYHRLEDIGATHVLTMPWVFYSGFEATLAQKVDGIQRFADDVIAKY